MSEVVNKHLTDSEKTAYLALINEYGEENIAVKQPDFFNVKNREFYEVKSIVELKNKDKAIYFGKTQYEEFKKINPYIICVENQEIYDIIKLDELEKGVIKIRRVSE